MSGERPRKKCSRDGEYGDDERICRRENVDETWIDVLSESTRQRQARLLDDATVRAELGLQDGTWRRLLSLKPPKQTRMVMKSVLTTETRMPIIIP